MLSYVCEAASNLKPDSLVLVTSPELKGLQQEGVSAMVIQPEPRGTGEAVRLGLEPLTSYQGPVLILCGDCPLIQKETLQRFLEHYQQSDSRIHLIAMCPDNPRAYGRVVCEGNSVLKIVEFLDATDAEKAISLCYSGVMMADAELLRSLLPQITQKNAQGEFYFTDIFNLAKAQGERLECLVEEAEEFAGVNTREELSYCEKIFQQRWRRKAQSLGVTFKDPESVFLCHDTIFGKDVEIEPFVVFGPHVVLKDRVKIRSFCHLESTEILSDSEIGPFARLRGETVIEEGSTVGNFVELKKTHLGRQTRVKHLSYLGDVTVGSESNIGAGTITCNYNGKQKAKTKIGPKTFIGSNAVLVAPLTVGEGAYIAAGSVVTDDVPAQTLAIGRARQVNKENWVNKHSKNEES